MRLLVVRQPTHSCKLLRADVARDDSLLLNVHCSRRSRRGVHHFNVVREESLLEEVLSTFPTLMSDVAIMTGALQWIRCGVEPVDRLTVLVSNQVLETSEMFHCVSMFEILWKFQQIFICKTNGRKSCTNQARLEK